MKKIFSIILIIFCIFSFNLCFEISPVFAENTITEDVIDSSVDSQKQQDDVLEKPVFEESEKTIPTFKKFTGKLSSLIIKIFGGILLALVVLICLSFIWIANLQRRKEKRKKQTSTDSNVINAVDNFARHRIKK